MFDLFRIYDDFIGLNDDDDYEETVFITREIPEELVDKFNACVDNLLADNGYDPLDFDEEED